MSDTTNSSRPVSLVTTVFIFVLFGLFAWVVVRYYHPAVSAPQNSVAENLPKELAWKATPAARKEALTELRAKQTAQASAYAWVAEKYGPKK